MKELPKTKDFTEGSDTHTVRKELFPPGCGDFIQQGSVVVCRQCPNNHTIPGAELDMKGKLVKKIR